MASQQAQILRQEIASVASGSVEINAQFVEKWSLIVQDLKKSFPPAEWEKIAQDLSAIAKEAGNRELAQNNNVQAVLWFGLAIQLQPGNHIFYSNRSAAFLSLGQYEKSLEDASMVVDLAPDWPKGYSRKGVALFYLQRYDESLQAYQRGLEKDPNNEILQKGVETVRKKVQVCISLFFKILEKIKTL